MSVRIIFRGLILFRFPGGRFEGDPLETVEKPTGIVAHLINKLELPRAAKARGRHEHYHEGQFQVLTGDPREDMAPALLRDGEHIHVTVLGGKDEGVVVEPSFLAHVPQLSDVIRKGSGNVEGLKPGTENRDLIQNTITINRGNIRARNVVTWDHGRFPLSKTSPAGADPASHALLNFVGSTMSGYAASEFVVDIEEATGVDLVVEAIRDPRHQPLFSDEEKARDKKRRDDKLGAPPTDTQRHNASNDPNHRVREGSVEILITNYEHQGPKAVPWGLDFQWLFEALGYPAVDLSNAGLRGFETVAREYDGPLYEKEVQMLLESTSDAANPALNTFTRGLPFPYIASAGALDSVKERRITDEESRPICIGAFQGGGP